MDQPVRAHHNKTLLYVLVAMTALECFILGSTLHPIRWSQWIGFAIFMLAS
jgi:hypothetical protein